MYVEADDDIVTNMRVLQKVFPLNWTTTDEAGAYPEGMDLHTMGNLSGRTRTMIDR